MNRFAILLACAVITGCAVPNTGVVPIGRDNAFMLSKMGGMLEYSGGQVKAELYKEAATFCASKGRQVVPGPSTSTDAGIGQYASAEIQFRCD